MKARDIKVVLLLASGSKAVCGKEVERGATAPSNVWVKNHPAWEKRKKDKTDCLINHE